MLIKKINNFPFGLTNTVRSKDIPRGAISDMLNFQSRGNKIELRRGFAILGNEITTAGGKITGLYRAKMFDGTERLYRTEGKKLKFYNTTTENWDEVGSDLLGTDADGQKITFAQFNSLAGDQLWICSPYGPLLKIMLANATSTTDLYDSTKNYKGYIKIKQNRMFLWGRLADQFALYISKIDTQTYTTVTTENIGTGNGVLKTFTDTLAFKAGGAKRTCFAITATDGTETFKDNRDGTLTGDAGGTGTINYTTGAISVTFNAAVTGAQAITSTYQWEDSTVGGIADFTFTSPTRTAGEGDVFRQDDGGTLLNVFSFGDIEYCIHEYKTWALTLTRDDTGATNLIYRQNVGIPARQAGVATGEGIYVINRGDDKDYELQLLAYSLNNDRVVPRSISKQFKYQGKKIGMDFTPFEFDRAVMFEWGDFILTACRTSASSINNRMIVYDRKQKNFALLDYYADEMAEYVGALLVGDTLLDNVYTVFSLWDDDDSTIPNFVILNEDDLDWEGLNKCKKMVLVGLIDPDQKVKVSVSVDNADFIEVGQTVVDGARTAYTIEGGGDYVDRGNNIFIGASVIGQKPIGGSTSAEYAFRYVREFDLGLDKFNTAKIKIECQDLGYFSVEEILYKDIRKKSRRLPARYVS